jgi:hypothetical protein
MEMSPSPTLASDAWAEQIAASLHAERESVREFLAAQQRRLERAESTIEELIARFEEAVENATAKETDRAADSADDLDYQRRYEMALDDLQELKASNALLQEQVSKARATTSTLARQNPVQHAGLDWETEKRRILAALESDLDENDSEQRAERLKIEDVLRCTEKAIADKDDELRELKQRIEESAAVSNLAQAATAVEELLQNDTVVQEEREKVRQLEKQWQHRLCQAEIEISLERAKLARERAELDERLRVLGSDGSKTAAGSNATGAAEPPTRGRWMTRLGLTDADREHKRR